MNEWENKQANGFSVPVLPISPGEPDRPDPSLTERDPDRPIHWYERLFRE